MTRTAVWKAILLLACLVGSGCYSTYRVRPGLDDLYVYSPGQEERSIEVELKERDYAAGAEGRRLRVAEKERGLELWVGPLRVSGKAQVVVKVRPAGYQGSPEAIEDNFRRFWEDRKAELDGTLGAAARDEIADEVGKFVAGLPPERLPRSVAAILKERFGLKGFDTARAQVDLKPGMRLRVETSVFQRTTPVTSEQGFVATETSHSLVSRRPDGKITFEPFVALLDHMGKAPGVVRTNGASDKYYFAASTLDLLPKDKEFSLYRLVYPKNFSNSHAMELDPKEEQVVLVGANCPKYLHWQGGNGFLEEEGKPETCLYDQEAKEQGCPDPAGGPCRFVSRFRGRALIVPEIPISVNGEPVWVSVGTTLRNVVEPFRDLSLPESLKTVRLLRRSGSSHARVEVSDSMQECLRVVNDTPVRDVCNPLDIPLLAGDRIVLIGGY